VFTIEKAHDDPIRDLAFAPHDNKFVTASDDATLKIFDFGSGTLETTITGHNWDAKTVDWHPSKGLLVSGSKDHQVKLWDPRNGGRCLTTLHGHKNTISKVAFEKTRGLVLATCARDTTPRVFDLRMMRDICLLRGHDRDISTLVWHPIHHSLLTTGDNTGCMNHYLLNEPNNPPGSDITIPVCEAKDPSTASAQIIWPRHQVKYAHDFSIWSMDWHPLGHILASGSNDKVTRFWSRARPGETDCFSDRYHVGEAVAEAQGTWSRNAGRRQQREEEDQEAEDEAEGLKDQAAPLPYQVPPGLGTANLPFPGIPGMGAIPPPANGLPGLNSIAPPQPPPNFSMNPERLQALLSQHQQNTNQPPLPFLPPGASLPFNIPPPTPGGSVVPPPNWMSNMPVPPPNWDWSKGPPPFPPPPPGGGPSPNMNAPPVGIPGMGAAGIPGLDPRIAGDAGGGSNSGAAGVRKRAPLPSQSESLKEEMRRGNYRHVR
jgi:polyadenylation factor subunit 2